MNQGPNASFALKVKVRRWSKVVRIGLADCPYCHRSDVCISRPKSLLEEVAILALLRPVRCRDCIRRFYRPLFVATPLRPLQSWKSKSQFNKRGRARMASHAQPGGDLAVSSSRSSARASSGDARVSAEYVERTQP
jgi:hypothetical protein